LQWVECPARNPAAFSALESPGPSLGRGRVRIAVLDDAQPGLRPSGGDSP